MDVPENSKVESKAEALLMSPPSFKVRSVLEIGEHEKNLLMRSTGKKNFSKETTRALKVEAAMPPQPGLPQWTTETRENYTHSS
jgi:hypothetical protein